MSRTTLATPVFWFGITACLILGIFEAAFQLTCGRTFDRLVEYLAKR